MSIINATAPYRRDATQKVRVPVAMPLVEVNVDQHGSLSVSLEHEPYTWDRALRREDLKRVLADIATDLDTPIRVEVHESDATTFTDIITPTELPPERVIAPTAPPPEPVSPAKPASTVHLAGDGFLPNEDVAIAVIVAHQTASPDGATMLRLPPALLEAQAGSVVLWGRRSGTIIGPGGQA